MQCCKEQCCNFFHSQPDFNPRSTAAFLGSYHSPTFLRGDRGKELPLPKEIHGVLHGVLHLDVLEKIRPQEPSEFFKINEISYWNTL